MDKLKIVVGFLLLYGFGKEYIHASKQLLTFMDPGIILISLAVIMLCAFLIGSGFSKDKFKFNSLDFLKFGVLSFLVFVGVAYFSLLTFKYDPEVVKINNMDINIAECMNGSKRIIPDEAERRTYCLCLLTTLTEDESLVSEFRKEFGNGEISKIIDEVKADGRIEQYNLAECMNSVSSLEWTPGFEQSVRNSMREQLIEQGKSTSNNIDEYCDCMLKEYKKIPVAELTAPEFSQTPKAFYIDSICNSKSLLK